MCALVVCLVLRLLAVTGGVLDATDDPEEADADADADSLAVGFDVVTPSLEPLDPP
jgi:hypothetical protein